MVGVLFGCALSAPHSVLEQVEGSGECSVCVSM